MLPVALAYARRRFEVFPVSPNKAPLTPHGFKDATTDPRQISAWWNEHPGAMLGTCCRWFFVVDGDIGKGGEHVLEGWRRVRGDFPRTWTARTGSGGIHYYFAHDVALDSVPLGKLYDGLDIKGGGRGYVLLPPSRNTKGVYRWITPPTAAALSKAPQWLISEIVSVKRPRESEPVTVNMTKYHGVDRVDRARRYSRAIPGAEEGNGGDNATWVAANKVARGFALTEDEAVNVLMSEFNPRCKPRWSKDRIRRHVSRALAIGNMQIGELLERGAA